MAVRDMPTEALIASSSTTQSRRVVAPPPRIVVWLSSLVAALALVASAVGLFLQDGPGEYAIKTVRGETVQIYGQGIYRYDTLFQGTIFRGSDAAMLFVAVPLLVALIVLYRRGSLRGRLLLTAALAYFVYFYANLAMGAAYSNLYLVYVALFSASLFALILSARSVDLQVLASHVSPSLPWRRPAIFMFAAGSITGLIWLSDVVIALIQGHVMEHLDSYTTNVTYVLDLAIIMPACLVAGFLLLRRAPLGYLMAFPLLGTIVLLAPTIIAQTVSQVVGGVTLTLAAIIGPICGFVILGVIALWLMIALLQNITDSIPSTT